MADGVDDPDGSDPTTFGDLALFGAARSGSSSAAGELRDRFEQALRTVAAGYRNRDVDREGLLDQVVGMLDAAPMPITDGGVPLTLFALVRTARLDESIVQGRPTGLVDLVGAAGAASLVAGTDASRRSALLGAYAALDDRDQVLLWFSAVEGTMPKALSGRLAIGGADMASTKTFRARSHLRHAYAERRTAGTDWPAGCAARAADLARLADREQPNITGPSDDHLATCPRCTSLLAELHALTSGLLDEAAVILHGIDTQRVRTGGAAAVPAMATAVAAVAAVPAKPPAAPIEPTDHFESLDAPASRGRAFAVAGVGLLVAAAIAAFVIWGTGHDDDQRVQVAPPITAQVKRVSVASPAPTASVQSATTSTSTTRRRGTTTTTRRPTTTRNHGSTGSTNGGWTPPPSTGVSPPTTHAPVTAAPTTAKPTTLPPTTLPPTTSSTTAPDTTVDGTP